jgi:hypothetical protein
LETIVRNLIMVLFALSVVYAVIGNAVVYVVLLRRKVPVRSIWAGVPTYLYRVCANADSKVGTALRRLALSTDVALAISAVLAIGLVIIFFP